MALSTPAEIFNSSNIGDFQVGFPLSPLQPVPPPLPPPTPPATDKIYHIAKFRQMICPLKTDGEDDKFGAKGINCSTIHNTWMDGQLLMASKFSQES